MSNEPTISRSCNQFLVYLDEQEEWAKTLPDILNPDEAMQAISRLREDVTRIGNDEKACEASKHYYLQHIDNAYELGVFSKRE